jgi:hypothetical protein
MDPLCQPFSSVDLKESLRTCFCIMCSICDEAASTSSGGKSPAATASCTILTGTTADCSVAQEFECLLPCPCLAEGLDQHSHAFCLDPFLCQGHGRHRLHQRSQRRSLTCMAPHSYTQESTCTTAPPLVGSLFDFGTHEGPHT